MPIETDMKSWRDIVILYPNSNLNYLIDYIYFLEIAFNENLSLLLVRTEMHVCSKTHKLYIHCLFIVTIYMKENILPDL